MQPFSRSQLLHSSKIEAKAAYLLFINKSKLKHLGPSFSSQLPLYLWDTLKNVVVR